MSERNHLSWEFDGEGAWEADSVIVDDGVPFRYRIVVCDDGTFDVSESDSELLGGTGKRECFVSLDEAKSWAAGNEIAITFSLGEPS